MFGKMNFAQAMRDIRDRTNERCLSADATIHDTTRHDDKKRMHAVPAAVGIGVNARAPTNSSQCESDKRTKKN